MDQPAEKKRNRFLTKRFVLSTAGLAIASAALWQHHLDGENWVFALAVVIAGHHAEDLVGKWKSK
jgi:hypothetical protein